MTPHEPLAANTTVPQRALAALLLVASILGAISLAYPLAHGDYTVGVVVCGLTVMAFLGFRRITDRRAAFSRRAAVVGAIVGIVIVGNILVRTAVGKPGASRTLTTQAALIVMLFVSGSLAAFLSSYIRIGLPGRGAGATRA